MGSDVAWFQMVPFVFIQVWNDFISKIVLGFLVKPHCSFTLTAHMAKICVLDHTRQHVSLWTERSCVSNARRCGRIHRHFADKHYMLKTVQDELKRTSPGSMRKALLNDVCTVSSTRPVRMQTS